MILYQNQFISICDEGEHGIYPMLDSEGEFLTNIYTEENIEDHINNFKKCENNLEATLEALEGYEDFVVVDKVEEINEFVNKVGNKYLQIYE